MLRLIEKFMPFRGRAFVNDSKEYLYKAKLTNPLSIGYRTIELLDSQQKIVGIVVESEMSNNFYRHFYVGERQVASMEGRTYRAVEYAPDFGNNKELKLLNIPWRLAGSVRYLQYWVIDEHDEIIFSYEHRWVRGSILSIFKEEHTILSILIALAVSEQCVKLRSSGDGA